MLASPERWSYQLSARDVDEIKIATTSAPTVLSQVNAGNFPLPQLSRKIKSWRSEVQHGCGVQVIKGFPLEMTLPGCIALQAILTCTVTLPMPHCEFSHCI